MPQKLAENPDLANIASVGSDGQLELNNQFKDTLDGINKTLADHAEKMQKLHELSLARRRAVPHRQHGAGRTGDRIRRDHALDGILDIL